MKLAWKLGLLATIAISAPAVAQQGELKKIATISVPGNPLDSFDISFVNQRTHRLFVADRNNKSIDVFDTQNNKYLGRVTGFTGDVPDDKGGPNGVLAFGNQAWASDGDSTIKVIDVPSMKVTDTISTGGQKRADEMAYDPKDGVFVVANADDKPGFVSFISTKGGHKILSKLVIDRATDGIEQPAYDTATGDFFIAIPQLDKNKSLGGIAQIDPKTFKLVKMFEVKDCIPQGLATTSDGQLAVGCHATLKDPPPATGVFDPKTGELTRIPGVGGGDEIAYGSAAKQVYVAANHMTGGAVLGVVDLNAKKTIQSIKYPKPGSHSVAVDQGTKSVFVPVPAATKVCGGCIMVYAPQ